MSDINGGQSPNPNGSPIQPGTTFAGPVLAGNVVHSDGTGNLAGLGGSAGTANVGYANLSQSAVITQATNGTVAGNFLTDIVIPAQSQIHSIKLMVTTAWSGGATTLGVGATAGTTAATALTTATGIQGSTPGQITATPSTAAQIANWDNTSNVTFQAAGPQDIRIAVQSGNTGAGVGTLTVTYSPGINLAS